VCAAKTRGQRQTHTLGYRTPSIAPFNFNSPSAGRGWYCNGRPGNFRWGIHPARSTTTWKIMKLVSLQGRKPLKQNEATLNRYVPWNWIDIYKPNNRSRRLCFAWLQYFTAKTRASRHDCHVFSQGRTCRYLQPFPLSCPIREPSKFHATTRSEFLDTNGGTRTRQELPPPPPHPETRKRWCARLAHLSSSETNRSTRQDRRWRKCCMVALSLFSLRPKRKNNRKNNGADR